MNEQGLLKIQDDMCKFITREVIRKDGAYFDRFSDLGTKKYRKFSHGDLNKFFALTHKEEYGVPGKDV